MLSAEYAQEVSRRINLIRSDAGQESEGEPWIYYLDHALHDPWAFEPTARPSGVYAPAADNNDESTTHFNVVDKDRNAVSCTHTGVFTSGTNPPSTGVYLVGGMAWFIPKAGYANSIAGWKRPLNNIAPLMAFENGRPVLCQGSPGARRIISRGIQVVNNILVFGMSPQRAIDAPTVDVSGNSTLVNARMPDEVIGALQKLGHRIEVVEEEPGLTGHFSRASAIQIDYENGVLRAGIDSFRPSMAVGY
jgi:gamma-glutamyltranspeptidase/glutathione hydrolase